MLEWFAGIRSRRQLLAAILLMTQVSHASAASVTFIGEISGAGPSVAVTFGTDGYDLYGTAPKNLVANMFVDGAFMAGYRLTNLPSYVESITSPTGADAASAAGFGDYSTIVDPADPGRQIRAGFETVHAPSGQALVPLLNIHLAGSVPPRFYIGFMTNIHADRPDDYPSEIRVAIGSSSGTVSTNQGGTKPNGAIDVYFFEIDGSAPNDQITIEARQAIPNPGGGRFNPSVSGLLFSSVPPPTAPVPPPLAPPGNQTTCTQDITVRNAIGNAIHIQTGTGTFAGLSPENKSVSVAAGQPLSGTINIAVHNGFPASAIAPLIGTASWGEPQSSWWLINPWLPIGDNTVKTDIHLLAPLLAGDYWIIFAFQGEMRGDQVASGTNWGIGYDIWEPGRGVATLTETQITEAQHCGFTKELRLYGIGPQETYLPADALTIHVGAPISSPPVSTDGTQGKADIDALLNAGQYGAAISAIKQSVQYTPQNAQLWLKLGYAYIKSGDMLNGQEAFDQATTLDPKTSSDIAKIYLASGKDALDRSDAERASQFFRLTIRYDPTLRAEVVAPFMARAKAALELRDVSAAEPLFDQAYKLDASIGSDIAREYSRLAETDYVNGKFPSSESLFLEAAHFDADVANQAIAQVWSGFAKATCNLSQIDKATFLGSFEFFNKIGLPDSTKETAAYRLAFAIELLETNRRTQGFEILQDLSTSSSSCQQMVAEQILAPPTPGERIITSLDPVGPPELSIQLVGVEVREHDLLVRLVFTYHGIQESRLWVPKPGWTPCCGLNLELPYLEDDNGTVLTSTTGYFGNAVRHDFLFPWQQSNPQFRALDAVMMRPGQRITLSATFPMITAGSRGFKFFTPTYAFGRVKLKPDPFRQ